MEGPRQQWVCCRQSTCPNHPSNDGKGQRVDICSPPLLLNPKLRIHPILNVQTKPASCKPYRGGAPTERANRSVCTRSARETAAGWNRPLAAEKALGCALLRTTCTDLHGTPTRSRRRWIRRWIGSCPVGRCLPGRVCSRPGYAVRTCEPF